MYHTQDGIRESIPPGAWPGEAEEAVVGETAVREVPVDAAEDSVPVLGAVCDEAEVVVVVVVASVVIVVGSVVFCEERKRTPKS